MVALDWTTDKNCSVVVASISLTKSTNNKIQTHRQTSPAMAKFSRPRGLFMPSVWFLQYIIQQLTNLTAVQRICQVEFVRVV